MLRHQKRGSNGTTFPLLEVIYMWPPFILSITHCNVITAHDIILIISTDALALYRVVCSSSMNNFNNHTNYVMHSLDDFDLFLIGLCGFQ